MDWLTPTCPNIWCRVAYEAAQGEGDATEALTVAEAAFAREALHRNELLAFHANFLYGWRAKCEKLRKLGLLFVDVAGGDVCRDPAAATCRS